MALVALCATAHAEGDKSDKSGKAQAANEKKVTAFIEKYDANGDGKLSAEELVTAMNDKAISIRGEKKSMKDKENDHGKEE